MREERLVYGEAPKANISNDERDDPAPPVPIYTHGLKRPAMTVIYGWEKACGL